VMVYRAVEHSYTVIFMDGSTQVGATQYGVANLLTVVAPVMGDTVTHRFLGWAEYSNVTVGPITTVIFEAQWELLGNPITHSYRVVFINGTTVLTDLGDYNLDAAGLAAIRADLPTLEDTTSHKFVEFVEANRTYAANVITVTFIAVWQEIIPPVVEHSFAVRFMNGATVVAEYTNRTQAQLDGILAAMPAGPADTATHRFSRWNLVSTVLYDNVTTMTFEAVWEQLETEQPPVYPEPEEELEWWWLATGSGAGVVLALLICLVVLLFKKKGGR